MTAADQPTAGPSVRGWVVVDKKTGALDWDGTLHPTHDAAYVGLRAYGDTVEAVRERRTFYDVLPVLDALPAPQPAADKRCTGGSCALLDVYVADVDVEPVYEDEDEDEVPLCTCDSTDYPCEVHDT